MNGWSCILIIFYLVNSVSINAQHIYEFKRSKQAAVIPFDYKNNFILVDIWLNDFIPMTFIFDTGAAYTVLSKKLYADLLGINYDREFKLIGADLKTEIIAHLAKGVDISTGEVSARQQNILVLEEDYLNFDKFTGVQVDGILGADFFRSFVVKIDYKREQITLYTASTFSLPQNYTEVPVQFKSHKLYVQAPVDVQDSISIPTALMLDTGAGLPLLLYSNINEELTMPSETVPGNIGLGLGGLMEGYIGRVHTLMLPPFQFDHVITSFQEYAQPIQNNAVEYRDGILGNVLLSRFTLLLHYPKEKLYLKARKNYNKGFEHDKSGLQIIATGKNLNHFTVKQVIPHTPAAEAGVQIGDQIVAINATPRFLLSMQNIHRKLRKREGKKIKLVLRRNGKRIVLTFRLRTYI